MMMINLNDVVRLKTLRIANQCGIVQSDGSRYHPKAEYLAYLKRLELIIQEEIAEIIGESVSVTVEECIGSGETVYGQ